MLELPEVITLAKQANRTLTGRKIAKVFNATKVHKFTFYNSDPLEYDKLLAGKAIESAKGYGMFVDLFLNDGRPRPCPENIWQGKKKTPKAEASPPGS